VLKLLLAEGADVDAVDENGYTALHVAAAHGHAAAVRELLEASDADADDHDGNTPAWAALEAGHSSVAYLILESGDADVAAACELGRSYLHGAARRNSVADTEWLLAHGASVTAKDQFSDTPLHAAAAAGAWAVGVLLLEAGAPANARGKVRAALSASLRRSARTAQNACTPLHVAAMNPSGLPGRLRLVELLLEKGADPAALNKACLPQHI
jgi:cytohesin